MGLFKEHPVKYHLANNDLHQRVFPSLMFVVLRINKLNQTQIYYTEMRKESYEF